jgi:hypothetical protein
MKNWTDLTARARRTTPPTDIDVRVAVRRAIEMEGRAPAPVEAAATVWDELMALAGRRWLRGVMAGGVVAATTLMVIGASAARELLDVAQIAGPLLFGF